MGLFDFLRRKLWATQKVETGQVPASSKPAVTATAHETAASCGSDKDRQIVHRQYAETEIADITNEYIDWNGLNGLSKEEAELARPFFAALFSYYHNHAVQHDHSSMCMRKECDLTMSQPVFLTASKVLCKNCALQYVIGNCRDWFYYLSDFAPHGGAIPSNIQKEGIRTKEQITVLRRGKTDNLSDEELLSYILDDNNDIDSRADAVLRIKSTDTVIRLVEKTKAYPILLNALEYDLPRDTLIKIIERQTMNNEWAGKVRRKATLKLNEEDLEAVLEGRIPGALGPAIGKIENKEFLQNYIQTTKYDDNREQAQKRLRELE